MQIIKTDEYITSIENIMIYISNDSINRALNFEQELNNKINNLKHYPFKFRQSIYFDDANIRDLIYKGYTIPYYIDHKKDIIIILGIKKYRDNF